MYWYTLVLQYSLLVTIIVVCGIEVVVLVPTFKKIYTTYAPERSFSLNYQFHHFEGHMFGYILRIQISAYLSFLVTQVCSFLIFLLTDIYCFGHISETIRPTYWKFHHNIAVIPFFKKVQPQDHEKSILCLPKKFWRKISEKHRFFDFLTFFHNFLKILSPASF